MKHFFRLIYYDYKEMGIIMFVPVLTIITVTVYGINLYFETPEIQNTKATIMILNLLQFFVPPLASWWIIIAFHKYVDEEGTEVVFSYGLPYKVIGIGRIVFFLIAFCIIVLISIAVLFITNVCNFELLAITYLILAIQSLFYSSCGFILILCCKNTVSSIAVILIIAFFSIWKNVPIISNYLSVTVFMQSQMSIEKIYIKLIFIVFISISFLYKAQKKIRCLAKQKYG